MPSRVAKQYSDRGSIKDIKEANEDGSNQPPTSQELRMKALYEAATAVRDDKMIESLGFVVMNGRYNDPVAILRHREYVEAIKARVNQQVAETQRQVSPLFNEPDYVEAEMRFIRAKQRRSTNAVQRVLVKTASATHPLAHAPASFWRAK
jgi:hypothetical protein